MKKVTITRKIQIKINSDDSKERSEMMMKLFKWNEIIFRAANYTSSHHFIQTKEKEFAYMNWNKIIKLADENKDDEGVLNTSRRNTTYRVLSEKFKGDVPMAMITAINSKVAGDISKDYKELFSGARSLRSYRRGIPMPAPIQLMSSFAPTDDGYGNYKFGFFGVNFKTYFGKDKSNNKAIFKKMMTGEYKLCDSSIKLKSEEDGTKIFLLAVFQFTSEKMNIGDSVIEAELSANVPVILNIDGKDVNIGDKEEFLHRRLAIQAALNRAKIQSRYNKCGKGRKKKMASTERFKAMEISYIQARHHQYSKKMIDLCLQNKCGILVLKNQQQKQKEAKANEFLLRNWSYYGFVEKIKYKCDRVGIKLVVEKDEKEDAEDFEKSA